MQLFRPKNESECVIVRIDSVDFFYLSMPEVTLEADGSQDALLVRVAADDGSVGWGECEASPLTSIAAFVTPRSHGVCQPVSASIIGESVTSASDIKGISVEVGRNSMDLLQAAHTWSGIEIALWDMLGKKLQEPVWRLLGYAENHPKTPYASMLIGETPEATFESAKSALAAGFRAVKFGWGSYGTGSAAADAEHIVAARDGIGEEAELLIDAGQIWGDDVEAAAERLPALRRARATWLEEPFYAHAYSAYGALAARSGEVRIAGGEGAHTPHMAINLIDYGGVGFIQVDSARIGGIGPSKVVADHALSRGVTYVNHTFTSHLALSASMQAFVGLREHRLCEYPAEPKQLAIDISTEQIIIDGNGDISAPNQPGLGVSVDLEKIKPYLQSVEIRVQGETIFESKEISGFLY